MLPENVGSFRRSLLRWYQCHGRDLPWRRTRDPYRVLVSEVMLQQTQIATVLPYYKEWLRRFPTITALGRASDTEVLHAWQGLGYYARAGNLHRAARLVMDRHHGRFPKKIVDMQKLPGVGKYTAHAVATFTFNKPVPIIETNTSRVVARLSNLRIPIDSTAGRNQLWNRAALLVPKKSAARFNSALVDLGALICLPRKPKCGVSPVQKFYRAKNTNSVPIKRARATTKRLVETHAFILRDDKLLLTKATNRWRGMWILPPFKLDRLNRSSSRHPLHASVFPFTNHRITLQVFRQRARKIDNARESWITMHKLASIPIPSPHRRVINALLAPELSVGR